MPAEPPPSRIREYTPRDEKQVRFMIGQAQMESLAYANNSTYFHPLTLAVWICVSSMFAQYMNWWPDSTYGILGWLQLLPAFFAPAVPIMFFVDWINRPYVEDAAEEVLRRVDLLDIQKHYARSPASGFWILEFSNKIIGLIAIDASRDATNDEPVTKQPKERLRERLGQHGTSRVAVVRHFFAEEAYRRVGIEEDVLRFAVKSTFGADQTVKSVRMLASPLRPAILDTLRRCRFIRGDRVGTIGILGWEVCWYTLERTQWEADTKPKET